MGQERLGPSFFFISLVLGPLNSLLSCVSSSRYIWSLAHIFCFCKNQQKSSSSADLPATATPMTRPPHPQQEDDGRADVLSSGNSPSTVTLQQRCSHSTSVSARSQSWPTMPRPCLQGAATVRPENIQLPIVDQNFFCMVLMDKILSMGTPRYLNEPSTFSVGLWKVCISRLREHPEGP